MGYSIIIVLTTKERWVGIRHFVFLAWGNTALNVIESYDLWKFEAYLPVF